MTKALPRTEGGHWVKGVSGNPRGRPRSEYDLPAMCREHTPAAVAALVAALSRPMHAVPAARELLDRGWGRPDQMVRIGTDGPGALHYLAASAITQKLLEIADETTNVDTRTINGEAHDTDTPALERPKPTE